MQLLVSPTSPYARKARVMVREKGLLDRTIVSEKPFRVRYSLTTQGESLEPVITAMRDWGAAHLREPAEPEASAT